MPLRAFAATLAIVVVVAMVSYASVNGFEERAHQMAHAEEVLHGTESLLSDLKDVDAGMHGYMLSGSDAFLVPYREARTRIAPALARLSRLVAGDAGQEKRMADLRALVETRLRQAEEFLGATDGRSALDPAAVRQHVVAGKSTMDAIRDAVSLVRAQQERLLLQGNGQSHQSSLVAKGVILVGTAACLAMLVTAYVFLRRYVADREHARAVAQAAAAETEKLYNGAPCGYHSVDRDGVFVRINDTELGWLGYSREELIGKKQFIDVVAPAYRQRVAENFPRLLAGKDTTDLEYELVRKDGSTFPVSVNALPLLDADGKFLMSRTTMFDISALRAARTRMEEANVFLDAVVENIPSMIFVKDARTLRFVRINRAEEKLLGISREDLIGKSDHDLFPPGQADFFVAKDREVLAGESVVEIDEEPLTTPLGTLILRTRKIGLRDAAGEPQYLLGISDDITAQKKSEQAIRALNASLEERAAQLEAANKELESFSYSVSHDLRAPLRAVDGYSRIFEEDYGAGVDDEGRRLLKAIRDNSRRMGMLIDDLLAFSRMGRQALSTQRVDMTALARAAVDEVRASGLGGAADIRMQDLPPALADSALIRQVWTNLLSNALKYSSTREAPSVEVGALPAAQGATYYVKDNGVGFDMRYYDKLFGVFQRLHRGEEFAGTGVGLAIVHRVVTRHGGRVWGEGEPGKGATFYFSLPSGGGNDGHV